MAKIKKLQVSKVVANISCYSLEGNLQEAIEYLTTLSKKYPNARLDYGMHDAYSDGYSFNIEITREETDEEYNKRVEAERLSRNNQLALLERTAKNLGYTLVKNEQ